MATASVARKRAITTIADLLEQLGGIPPERVRWQPTPGTATEKDLIEIEAREDRTCELVEGTLVEKPICYVESFLAAELIRILGAFVAENDRGVVVGESGPIRLMPGLVRMPDVSFVSWKRLPGGEMPTEPIPDLAPDLAVEVLSANNTAAEMQRKIREYFRAGVRLVWVMDPVARQVTVYTSPTRSRLVGEDDVLTGGKVLPGFTLSVRDWLRRARRRR